jgi:uncharacterized protein
MGIWLKYKGLLSHLPEVGQPKNFSIGHSYNNRSLLVSFTERSGAIRIISAREATRDEKGA